MTKYFKSYSKLQNFIEKVKKQKPDIQLIVSNTLKDLSGVLSREDLGDYVVTTEK